MKKFFIYAAGFLFLLNHLSAQSNVRGWYAKGQVWIVWQTPPDDSAVYEVYESDMIFTSVSNANLIGKLFYNEWKAGALRDQVNQSMKTINFKIPRGQSTYRLGPNEGVFVKTPHDNGSKYYAVVKSGDAIIKSNNITNSITHVYQPYTDPIQCHAQLDTTWEIGRHKARYYYMWADGRQDYWNSRADFPVMANIFKNGMPSLFLVSEARGMDTTAGKKIPATLWLHGGGGGASGSKPLSREQVNIEPKKGILVAHNDDFFRIERIRINNRLVDTLLDFHTNTWFFGWAKHENPFDTVYHPKKGDTIINYTQRRLIWINDWLVKNYNVDPHRISVNGHSMGSAGTTALMKAYPEKFATATIFNNGLAGPDESDEDGSQGAHLFGIQDSNLCTNLLRRGDTNKVVHIYQAFNLNDRNSSVRDFPLVRMYHGKNDDRGVMRWDSFVVNEYKKADSLGWGMQLYWGERKHGLEGWWDRRDHWSTSAGGDKYQTFRDNVSYEETFRSDISYPGFFNHRADKKNHDPGDGTVGTDTIPATDSSGGRFVGHDWGTWGGYHEWNRESIIDKTGKWRVTAWLIGKAANSADISPDDSLTAHVSIRRPQQFKPATGSWIDWFVVDSLTKDTLQHGTEIVREDSLVVIPAVKVYKETIRKVYIEVRTAVNQPFMLSTKQGKALLSAKPGMHISQNFPNPAATNTTIRYTMPLTAKTVQLIITDNAGRRIRQLQLAKETSVVTIDAASLGSGTYHYTFIVDGRIIASKKMVVAH